MAKYTVKRKYAKDQLSDPERNAICRAFLEGLWDWKQIYIWSHPETKSNDSSLQKQGSRLKTSIGAQEYIKYLDKLQEQRDQELKEKTIKDYLYEHPRARMEDKSQAVTDYRDREKFIEDLNNRINCATDEKIKTDLMKLMADLLRLKEAQPGKDNEIARYYMPLGCQACELYKQGQKGLERIIRAKEKADNMTDGAEAETA